MDCHSFFESDIRSCHNGDIIYGRPLSRVETHMLCYPIGTFLCQLSIQARKRNSLITVKCKNRKCLSLLTNRFWAKIKGIKLLQNLNLIMYMLTQICRIPKQLKFQPDWRNNVFQLSIQGL